MGLDQYAYSRPAHLRPNRDIDFDRHHDDRLFCQWRKHPDLEGWMAALYRRKGGHLDPFNCVPVGLTADDIDALEADVLGNALPYTIGFFFGTSREHHRTDDMAFIAAARRELAGGRFIYYSSWW